MGNETNVQFILIAPTKSVAFCRAALFPKPETRAENRGDYSVFCCNIQPLFVKEQVWLCCAGVGATMQDMKNTSNKSKRQERKRKPSFVRRLSSANRSLVILVAMLFVGLGVAAYGKLNGVVSPREQAGATALAYMKAYVDCDWEKIDAMRVVPLSDAKKECAETTSLGNGQEVSSKELSFSIKNIEYSNEKDPEIDPEGKIESAVVLPAISYRGKELGGLPNLIMLTRSPELGNKWLVMSP